MSVLSVANVQFNATGSERIDFVSGNIRVTTAGSFLINGTAVSPGSAVGASVNTQILFNDAGSTNGSNGLVFNRFSNTFFANTVNVTGTVFANTLNAVGYIYGNGAFLTGISAGATINDQSTTNFLQYPVFTTTTSGTATSLNVATTRVTFNVATGTLSATIFNTTSDENKKDNIITISNSLNIVEKLRGVGFNWKDNGRPSYGLIAQEVEQVIPEIVETNSDGTKTLNYDAIIGFLIEAIKDLSAKVGELEKK